MNHRVDSVAAAALALVFALTASLYAPAQTARAQSHPKTAWGDPDLTGAYAEFTTAPLERAPELGEKEFFTPENTRLSRSNGFRRRLRLTTRSPERRKTSTTAWARSR
jgi:hypothetical protein